MRPVTLLVVVDETDSFDPYASEQAAREQIPGVEIDKVVLLSEERLGGWLTTNRARRCRSRDDVHRTPEREQPVVVDIDLNLSQ